MPPPRTKLLEAGEGYVAPRYARNIVHPIHQEEYLLATLLNGSGALVPQGSCVVVSTTANTFSTSTTQDATGHLGVTLEDIPSGGQGQVAIAGVVRYLRAASGTTAGQYLRQSTTAGVAEGTASPTQGTFAFALTARDAGTGTVEAVLSLHPLSDLAFATRLATKTSDESRTSTSLSADSELTLTVANGSTYELEGLFTYNGILDNGLKLQLSLPSNSDGLMNATYIRVADSIETTTAYRVVGSNKTGNMAVIRARCIGGRRIVKLAGVFTAGAAGSLSVLWASDDGGTVTLLDGSVIRLTEVN